MKANDSLHGFTVRYVQPLPELKATLYRMEYDKNGADLVWLDRKDDNKSFGIAFKTIPHDNTGVFHILEHSVLCGSDKYPVKEPFVELLKSSLQTFLNAMTFPDKTVYPLSSRNDQDFLNLIDVYMDAVLHPLSITSPTAYRQEGWHYELDDVDGELTYNGVVFNEMKGAYASPDTVLWSEFNKALFPDTCYGYESGGNPEYIPELSYEEYLACHHRFYHPSNARIFLDGSIELDAVLAKLDSFLKDYDRIDVDADIPMQPPVNADRTGYYEIGREEDPANKVLLAQGWVFGDYSQQEKAMAASVLADVLCGSNESPLKKALLEQGLCEDVDLSAESGTQQMYMVLVVRNTSEEKKDKVFSVVNSVLSDLAEKGLDRKHLESVINHMEFVTRERDFGRMPRGLIYGLSTLDSWLYGGDPAQNLCYDETFRKLREGLDKGYFESFLREAILENPHSGRICLLPSVTLGEEKQQKEREALSAVRAAWDDDTAKEVIREFKALRAHQETPDTPDQLAKLPLLSLGDISDEVSITPQNVSQVCGRTVLHHPIETDGIVYTDMYFALDDIPTEKLSQVSFLSSLLCQVATESFSAIDLRSEIDSKLGRLNVSTLVTAPTGCTDAGTPYVVVSCSALESRMDEAVRLLREVLCTSRFTEDNQIYNLLRQDKIETEQRFIMSGNAYGLMHVAAEFSSKAAILEEFQGLNMLRWLQNAEKSFEEKGKALCQELAALCGKIFVRSRMTLSVTGTADEALFEKLLGCLPEGKEAVGEAVAHTPNARCRLGITIPAPIGFAVKGANLFAIGDDFESCGRVASQILTYDYLWNTIRVKGGAYGTGLVVRNDGDVVFTSFRDPSAGASLDAYDKASASLRAICDSGEPLDRYIISTVAELEPVTTPRLDGSIAATQYLSGITTEDRRDNRRKILRTTPDDLRAFCDRLDKVCENAGICVVGGKEILDACGEKLDKVEPLQ